VHHRVHRPGAERLGVAPRCVDATDVFGYGFGQIAATAIVPVANGLFRATDDKVDIVWLDLELP